MTRRTYWHLEALGRRPTDYEIGTSRLLYYLERGFEVQTPLAAWYAVHQRGCRLVCDDWERFADPRATTYAKYTELMRDREVFVERLLACPVSQTVEPAWIDRLDRILGPLRYPVHGLQMIAAYVGSMAPSGRVVVTAMFQAADELRRVEHLSRRMLQLGEVHPRFGRESRATWENDGAWQPLRRLIEELLVTYDWGEALVALNGAVKPMFDSIFLVHLAAHARAQDDDVLEKILLSLGEDARWHRAWFDALMRVALADRDNHAILRGWLARWQPRVRAAFEALEPLFEDAHNGAGARFARLSQELGAKLDNDWTAIGLVDEPTTERMDEQRA